MTERADRCRLHVGVDAEKVLVGPYRLRTAAGRACRRRWAAVTETRSVAPSGRGRGDRAGLLSLLALVLLLLCVVLTGLGVPWWCAAVGSVLVLGAAGWDQHRAAAPGVIAVPRVRDGGPPVHVLHTPEEREAFLRLLATGERIHRTWPALRHMIDPASAEPLLNRALYDLAAVLAQRQQLRQLRVELAGVRHGDLPAGSPAVFALDAQRRRAEQLWQQSAAVANRHITSIHGAAVAGESLIRERLISQTAREAERAMTQLTSAAVPAADIHAGQELADRTAAVVGAYRELAVRYGGDTG